MSTLDIYMFVRHDPNISKKEAALMEQVNALTIRNRLGEILDRLTATGEPILVSKGRKLRAVLVTPEDFEKRFLDYKVKEDKKRLLDQMHALRKKKKGSSDSISILRQLRGYDE
jgi:PHD/YefM family antitoxin component YafN of YafNO toxin-antitoxin module